MKRPDITRAQLGAVATAIATVLAAFHWDASPGTVHAIAYSAAAVAAVWIGGDAHIRGRRAMAAAIAPETFGGVHRNLGDVELEAGGNPAASTGGAAPKATA